MNIKFDDVTLTAVVDQESYCKLTRGTEFQRSIGLLSMISQIWENNYCAQIEAMNLTPAQYKLAFQNMNIFRNEFFRLHPPPSIDLDALSVFCD